MQDLKFLESTTNIKALIKNSIGRTPSTTISSQIAVCIQQGRHFFEAATASPLQIKPLQIYYGALSFAKAVILARNLVAIDTLTPSHGLKDVSDYNSGIEHLTLQVGKRGTFQDFNSAVATLGRIWYYENAMMKWTPKPFDGAEGLVDQRITITEIFSRIPNLSGLPPVPKTPS